MVSTLILIIIATAATALLLLFGGLHPYLNIPAYGLTSVAGLLTLLRLRNVKVRNQDWSCLLASCLFLGYILLRALNSPASYLARADLYLVLAALIIYLIFALVLTSSRQRIRFATLLLVIATANFIVGGIQFFKGHNFMPFEFLPRGNYGARASGFFGCPNHLAGFLEVAMLLGLSLACWSRYSLLARITAGYASAMCAVGILISGSRGGYVSSIAGLLAFGFISLFLADKWLRREFWYAVVASAILVAVGMGLFVRAALQKSDYLEHRVETVNLDLGLRTQLAMAAIKQLQLNPLFGTGSRTYLYYGREFRGSMVHTDPIYAHNDYAQLLGEYGLAGFAGFAIFIGFHGRGAWRSLQRAAAENAPATSSREPKKRSGKGSRSRAAWRTVADGENERLEQQRPAFKGSHSLALAVGAASSVVAYIAHSFVDFNLHIPANTCVMAFIFGMLASPGISASSARAQHGEAGSKWAALAQRIPAGLGLWLMIAALPTWPGEFYGERARRLLSDWHLLDSPEIASKAEVLARKGLKYDSKNPELFYYLGEAQIALANLAETPADRTRLYEESIDTYKRAMELAPLDANYILCLAWSLDAIERFDEAESAYAHALELDPNSEKIHSSYAGHFHQQKKLEQAEAEYALAFKIGNLGEQHVNLRRIRKEIADKKAQENPEPAPPQ